MTQIGAIGLSPFRYQTTAWSKADSFVYYAPTNTFKWNCIRNFETHTFIFGIVALKIQELCPGGGGGWFNVMMSYQYKDSHYKNKAVLLAVLWPSHLNNENPYAGKTTSFYWIGPHALLCYCGSHWTYRVSFGEVDNTRASCITVVFPRFTWWTRGDLHWVKKTGHGFWVHMKTPSWNAP